MNRLLVGIMLLAIVCIAGSCTDEDEYTQGQSFRLTEFDQRNDFPAIMGTDQLSFTPQIASAFFDNISIVAASANALSFLAISRSFLAFSFLSSDMADI